MNSATQAVMPEVDRGMEPQHRIYFRFDYPPSTPSEEDTESIDSIQDKETDFVQDTSEADVGSDTSDQVDLLEYEVASLSEDDADMLAAYSTSDTEDLHESAIVAALCDSSLDAWATDGETSDSSAVDSGELTFMDLRKDFWNCVQCKLQKQNPAFRYCDKCFQQRCWQCKTKKSYQCFPLCHSCFKVRKTLFPPRPRGNRKRKLEKTPQVKLDTLQSCLKQLSQESVASKDSAIGSTQELSGLDFNKIVVPAHLRSPKRTMSSDSDSYERAPPTKLRKLLPVQDAQKSDSGYSEAAKKTTEPQQNSQQSDSGLSNFSESQGKDLCIMCNTKPKNGLFIHSRLAHMCCCYSCSIRTWKTNKKCPVCNCKVKNVMQLFTA